MNDLFYSVNEIDGNFALLEFPDGTFKNVALSDLPAGIKEGNILKKSVDGSFTLDFQEEKRRKKHLLELQDKIFG